MQPATHPYDGVTLLGVQSAVVIAAVVGGLAWFIFVGALNGTLILGAGVVVGFVINAWVQFLFKARSRGRASDRPTVDRPSC